MRIALSQLASGTAPKENLAAITAQTERAAEEGAEVVVFPEAAMARFGIPLAPLAEPLDGGARLRRRAPAGGREALRARDVPVSVGEHAHGPHAQLPDRRRARALLPHARL